MAFSAAPFNSFWLAFQMMLAFTVAPCALFLAKGLASFEATINWHKHWVMIGGGWFCLLPLVFILIVKPLPEVNFDYGLLVHGSMLVSVAIFVVQSGLVVRTCCLFLRRRLSQNRVLLSTLDDSGLDSLRILTVALIITTSIALFRVLYCALWDHEPAIDAFVAAMQLILAGFISLSVMRHVLIEGNANEVTRRALFSSDETGADAAVDKYGHSQLSVERHQEVLGKVLDALDNDQIYKRPGLSLSELCAHVHESPHIVSQVINSSELKNFYDMVNRRRVALAEQALLSDGGTSVLDIALTCGFNSKSSFNSVFKRYTGLTPSQYRSQNTPVLNRAGQ